MLISELIDTYCCAWSDPDAGQRAKLLQGVFSSDASYTDPSIHAQGRDALLAHISSVIAKRPGSMVQRTSEIDSHHDLARFSWRATAADGSVLVEGIDVIIASKDGAMIEKVIGFFDALKRS
ncbi:MAG: hypothetical protein ACRCWF_07525 [Beijerinckiaceae bacterium]